MDNNQHELWSQFMQIFVSCLLFVVVNFICFSSPFVSHSLSLSLTHTHTHSLSLSHTHTLTYSLSLSLSPPLSHTQTHTHSHFLHLSFSNTYIHVYTYTMKISDSYDEKLMRYAELEKHILEAQAKALADEERQLADAKTCPSQYSHSIGPLKGAFRPNAAATQATAISFHHVEIGYVMFVNRYRVPLHLYMYCSIGLPHILNCACILAALREMSSNNTTFRQERHMYM